MIRQTITLLAITIGIIGVPLLIQSGIEKAGAAEFVGSDSGTSMSRQRYGILGHSAPELNLLSWIDADGKATDSIRLSDFRGKVVYLYFFQHWCPGCHAHGFPTLQTIAQAFKGDDQVVLLAVQTAFEGKSTNTQDKLRKNQIDYELAIPMAHDNGNANPRGLPQTMIDYRSGGTPWTVIINPEGKVVYNQFHIDALQAIDLMKSLQNKVSYKLPSRYIG